MVGVTRAPARHLVQFGPGDLADRLSEALQVYVSAMGYPPSTARQRRTLWLDHVRRPGWRAVGWLDAPGALLGIAYGYVGGARAVVVRGGPPRAARQRPRRPSRGSPTTSSSPSCTCGPTRRARVSARASCGRCWPAPTARTCCSPPPSTPRFPPGGRGSSTGALGFRDVLREHRFTGDSRPFAVLGRRLPLDPPPLSH